MAKQQRVATITANVDVIDELPGKVRVRAKAPPSRLNDARPLAGFLFKRYYDGEEFYIADWRQFSKVWMEFVDEPPKEWVEAMELNEIEKAALRAKHIEEEKQQQAAPLMFALSQVLGAAMKPGQFDFANGRPRE